MSSGSQTARKRPTRPASLSEDQRRDIKHAFDLFDTQNSGSIDFHELKVAMRALGFDVKKAEVIELMNVYDKDGSGRVTFGDFLEIMKKRIAERDPQEEMLKAFELFDDDNTGKISLKNLRRVARDLGENVSEEDLQSMIDEFDRDLDGESEPTRNQSRSLQRGVSEHYEHGQPPVDLLSDAAAVWWHYWGPPTRDRFLSGNPKDANRI